MKLSRELIIMLLAFLAAGAMLFVSQRTTAAGSGIEEDFLYGRPSVALTFSYKNTNPVEICIWENETDKDAYLFLPSGIAARNLSWNLHGVSGMTIDGEPVQNGEKVRVSDGEHELSYHTDAASFDGILHIMQSANLKSVFIDTDNHDSERLSWHPDIILSGSLLMLSPEGKQIHSDVIPRFHSRGNTTFDETDKKSFLFALGNKADLLGGGAAKKYILLANDFDPTLLRNAIAYDIAESLQVPYAVKHAFTDLYIDGVYAGNYLMCEKVEIAKNRIRIRDLEKETEEMNAGLSPDEYEQVTFQEGSLKELKGIGNLRDPSDVSGGYLLELENPVRYEEEPAGVLTSRGQPVVIKSPEAPSYREVSYIGNLFQEMEDAVYAPDGINPDTGRRFSDYVDVDSFARHYLVEEICKNYDAFYTSQYLFKPEGTADTRFFAGPSWDFDNAIRARTAAKGFNLTSPDGLYAGAETSEVNLWNALYCQEPLLSKVKDVYCSEGHGIIEDMVNRRIPEMMSGITPSFQMNAARWNKSDYTGDPDAMRAYTGAVQELQTFLEKRAAYLLREWSK